jgi:hypothetical protein
MSRLTASRRNDSSSQGLHDRIGSAMAPACRGRGAYSGKSRIKQGGLRCPEAGGLVAETYSAAIAASSGGSQVLAQVIVLR